MHCLYATCSSGMLGYVITNRKSVTLPNTRINAGVLNGPLSLKLRLRGMAFACIIKKNGIKIERKKNLPREGNIQ